MSHYFVAQLKIHDQETYDQYLERFDQAFESFQGKVIAVDDQPVILEGTWNYSRFVIIEFPSGEELERWYRSPLYQEIARFRWAAATGTALVVEGVTNDE